MCVKARRMVLRVISIDYVNLIFRGFILCAVVRCSVNDVIGIISCAVVVETSDLPDCQDIVT